jgi:hypothetical protein
MGVPGAAARKPANVDAVRGLNAIPRALADHLYQQGETPTMFILGDADSRTPPETGAFT